MLKPHSVLLVAVSLALVAPSAPAFAKLTTTDVKCLGTQRCTRLSNGTVDVTVTRDVGPRVIGYGFTGSANVLAEMPLPQGQAIDVNRFTGWGGHRLWHAPEQAGRTYVPDNTPPQAVQVAPGQIRLTAAVEVATNLQKEMEVKLDAAGTRVTVTHRLKNVGPWSIEAAPWAVSVMRGGGTAIVPNEPVRPHQQALLPARPMALWAYTNLGDKRFTFGTLFMRVSSNAAEKSPLKVGVGNRQGWAAYVREDTMFLKRMPFEEGATYPDYGSNVEIYTAGDFIEVESLGPLRSIAAGQAVQHVESWQLFKGVAVKADDVALAAALAPLVAKPAATGR